MRKKGLEFYSLLLLLIPMEFISLHMSQVAHQVQVLISCVRSMKQLHVNRPSDRVRKKMKNEMEIFGNIMRKKVTIMRKDARLCRNF